ncbi:hypothetical protein MBLNU457_g2399t1 [Dothideomycetes sp. NU457]
MLHRDHADEPQTAAGTQIELGEREPDEHDLSRPQGIKEVNPTESEIPRPTDLPAIEKPQTNTEAYSSFTVTQKRLIILAGTLAGFLSPLTGSIYYPAITTIAKDLKVSTSAINVTVTTYLIVQGLAPMIIAGFSDNCGRRPAFILCFVIFMAANLGLGLQNSYVALLILRMVQSGGSSGTIALSQGVVGDTITSAERGSYIAITSITGILGPTLSPILGGILSQYLGWHSVFWFLLIFAGVSFLLIGLFMPETCRRVVGDASFPGPWLNWNLTDHWRHARRARQGVKVDEEKLAALRANYSLSFPNPLGTLAVLGNLETFLILLSCGFAFACFYAISTGASRAFHTLYGFDDLYVALMFIPIGVGGTISAFTTGRLVDWNYRRHAKRLGFPVVRNRQQDLIDFPIEKARLEIALPLFYLGAAAVLGYGWMMDHKISLAGPIIMLFILGYALTASFQTLNVLIIDIYPGRAATATAANNIMRCELGAAATAAIGPMSEAMGNGWAYTLLALLFVATSPCLWLVQARGMKWRKQKRDKEKRKEQEKKEKALQQAEAIEATGPSRR